MPGKKIPDLSQLLAILYQMFRMYCAWYDKNVKGIEKDEGS
jgi:hypothetical protein